MAEPDAVLDIANKMIKDGHYIVSVYYPPHKEDVPLGGGTFLIQQTPPPIIRLRKREENDDPKAYMYVRYGKAGDNFDLDFDDEMW